MSIKRLFLPFSLFFCIFYSTKKQTVLKIDEKKFTIENFGKIPVSSTCVKTFIILLDKLCNVDYNVNYLESGAATASSILSSYSLL